MRQSSNLRKSPSYFLTQYPIKWPTQAHLLAQALLQNIHLDIATTGKLELQLVDKLTAINRIDRSIQVFAID